MKKSSQAKPSTPCPDGRAVVRALYGKPNGSPSSPERVPFDSHVTFHDLRSRAVRAGRRYGEPYASLLACLADCEPLARHAAEEARGASYKRLCGAAHAAGFTDAERKNLYWIAERVGLSDRFAGHLIASLKRNPRRTRGGRR